MNRRRYSACLLSLLTALVLFGQSAGLLHALSHGTGARSGPAPSLVAERRGADAAAVAAEAADPPGSCEKCFAFAHLASTAPLGLGAVATAEPAFDASPASTSALLPADAPVSRSRGPPALS